ncbi:hypothetical protein Tco_0932552 [Tanacetum coccineum]
MDKKKMNIAKENHELVVRVFEANDEMAEEWLKALEKAVCGCCGRCVAQTGRSVTGTLPGKSVGDLLIVNEEKGVFGTQDLMKVALEVLRNRWLGSAYKATLESGVLVVVKRVREMY